MKLLKYENLRTGHDNVCIQLSLDAYEGTQTESITHVCHY